MAIVHRFIDDLENLENHQTFCGQQLKENYRILVIGTFNPNDDSCEKVNGATWFYGRNQSKFWKYLPTALTGESLHPTDGHIGHPQTWKQYCIDNNIIIIDLVKRININDLLPDFGDNKVECKINHDLSNTEEFQIERAFRKVTFDKVIYSLLWADNKIVRLRRIRDKINDKLVETGCINNLGQIKYCKTPSRNDASESWDDAINNG